MACGIKLSSRSLANIELEAKALANIQLRSLPLAKIAIELGCPPADDEDAEVIITQSDWYVGGPLGNDNNSGVTPSSPFATYDPLNSRIGSPMARVVQDTTVHVLGDIPFSSSPLVFRGTVDTPYILRVRQEAPTSLGQFTLGGATTNITVGSAYPQVQAVPAVDWTTAGPGGTSLVGKRFRKVSGPGAAPVGTLFWLEEPLADPTIAYVNRPQYAAPPLFVANQSLTSGDVYEVEDLGVMGRLNLQPQDNQIINFATQTCCVSVENGKGVAVEDESFEVSSVLGPDVGTAGVCVHGCEINYGRAYADFTSFQACKMSGTLLQIVLYCRRLAFMSGCSVQGPPATVSYFQFAGNGELQLFNSVSFSARKLWFSPGTGIPSGLFYHSPSFRNWSSGAILLGDSKGRMQKRPWGTSAVAGSYGLNLGALGRWTYDQLPTVSGQAAYDYDIGGIQDTYANGPLPVINPANGAMLVAHT